MDQDNNTTKIHGSTENVYEGDLSEGEGFYFGIVLKNTSGQALSFTLSYSIDRGTLMEWGETTLTSGETGAYAANKLSGLSQGSHEVTWYINGYEAGTCSVNVLAGTAPTPTPVMK